MSTDDTVEPDIIINGAKLTKSQAMTVRVALESFAIDCDSYAREHPEQKVWSSYLDRMGEIRKWLYFNQPGKVPDP